LLQAPGHLLETFQPALFRRAQRRGGLALLQIRNVRLEAAFDLLALGFPFRGSQSIEQRGIPGQISLPQFPQSGLAFCGR
jgi:hypothetical protein